MESVPERVELGRVASVTPGKREARVKIAANLTLDTAVLGWAWFSREGAWTRYKVARAAASEGELRLYFAPGVPMDTVRGLHGAQVAVAAEVVTSRGPLWRRVGEMVDLAAETREGEHLGTVMAAYAGPKMGAIKVESDKGKAWTLPVNEQTVLALDTARGVVVLGEIDDYEEHNDAD